MKTIIIISCLAAGVFLFCSFAGKTNFQLHQSLLSDSLEKDRAKFTAIVSEQIKGKENLPADSVFKNIKMLKGIPAKRLLAIMNLGYCKSLGVSCGHCHNTDEFSSEEKEQKEITRQMAAMNKEINNNLLKNIKNLKSNPAIVNCTTCHRGDLKPALNIQ